MTIASGQDWLTEYLAEFVAKNLCTRPVCTTCGALEFRSGLRRLLSMATGAERDGRLTPEIAIMLARALATVRPFSDHNRKHEEAIRLILYDIWYALGPAAAERDLLPVLQDTWAGDLLARMKEHYRLRVEAYRRHEERSDPDKARLRRAERKGLRQAKHAGRLAKKKERDRLWRKKHDGVVR